MKAAAMSSVFSFGGRLKSMRVERKLTQTDIASALGVSKAAVSAWEVGRSAPDLLQLKRIAHVLGISCAELLGEDAHEARAKVDSVRLAATLTLVERHGGRAYDQLTPEKRAQLVAYLYAQEGALDPQRLAALIGLAT